MNRSIRHRFGPGRLAASVAIAALLGSLTPVVVPATALAATVDAATVASMPATSAKDAPTPSWTDVSGPVLHESAAGQFANNSTIILTIPATFEFNTSGGAAAPGGTGCATMVLSGLSHPDAQHVSVTINTQSTAPCDITWNGLQVRPTSKSLGGLAQVTGSITNTGTTASVLGASGYGTLTEVPGAAAALAFSTQPSFGLPGVAFQGQPAVIVADAVGNRVFSASATTVALTLSTNPGGGSAALACSQASNTATTSQGLATFSGCQINVAAIGYRLTASGTYTSASSSLFDVANTLVFTTQPVGAKGGVPFSTQPVVEIRVGSSKAVNTTGASVQLSIYTSSTTGGSLTCTTNPVLSSAGVATFATSGCAIDKVGTYTLKAAAGLLSAISSSLSVTAGLASKVTFIQQPAGAAAGQAFTTQPIVAITDAGGNVVTSGASATVVLSIGANPGVPAGVLTCTSGLSVATATSGANAGKAVFTGCAISNAGVGYTLVATPLNVVCGGNVCTTPGVLASAASTAFTVTAPAAEITLTPSAGVITWGSTVYLTTHFAKNGAGKTFTIQGSRDGATWTAIATRTADASGSDSFAYRPATNLWYRAVFAGTSDLVAGTSNQPRVTNRQIALLRPTSLGQVKAVSAGTSVTFTTTVRPARPELPAAKVTFRFYRYAGGRWTYVTKRDVYIDATGRASWTWTFSTRGEWYVRSIANPTPYNANSVWSPVERYSVR
jgi:hypothetical protein